jgi:hypothetical protein
LILVAKKLGTAKIVIQTPAAISVIYVTVVWCEICEFNVSANIKIFMFRKSVFDKNLYVKIT